MTDHAELRSEISWLEARNREVNLQRIEAETTARSQAARIAALVAERDALREALAFTREALFSALAGSNAAGDAETVDDVLRTLQWMADHLNPAYSLCVSVLDGKPPAPHFQKDIDAKRAEYAALAPGAKP